MPPVLFKKKELLSLFVWSFFSYAVIRFTFLFIYLVETNLRYFLMVILLHSLLSFLNYFIFKIRFGVRQGYLQYIICNVLFSTLVTSFSYGYYFVVMLPGDQFKWGFYFRLFLLNVILGSLLFLFTLIKKRAV